MERKHSIKESIWWCGRKTVTNGNCSATYGTAIMLQPHLWQPRSNRKPLGIVQRRLQNGKAGTLCHFILNDVAEFTVKSTSMRNIRNISSIKTMIRNAGFTVKNAP